MDDIKLDYLERMKSLLDKDDIANLNKYIARIKKKVEGDPIFQEIFAEVENKNYDLAFNIIEESIFENSENEFKEEFVEEESYEGMNDDEMFLGSNSSDSAEYDEEYHL